MTLEQIVEKFTQYPSYLKKGNQFLSEKWNVNIADIKAARSLIPDMKDSNGIDNKILNQITSDEFPYSNKYETNIIWHKTKDFSIQYINKETSLDKESMKDILSTWIESNKQSIVPLTQENLNTEGVIVTLHLADMHIGADCSNSQYDNDFNIEVLKSRLTKVFTYIKQIPYKIKTLLITDLGDSLDGYNSQTTRGGHRLPQNLNNKQQFIGYMDIMSFVFDNIVSILPNTKILFKATQGNHGGDFEWISQTAFKSYAMFKYPNIDVEVTNKFINHIILDNHCIIFSHGKDDKDRKYGLPLNLDSKTEMFIQDYIDYNKLHNFNLSFIKGDLHKYNLNESNRFRYKNCPSLFGSSNWIQNNFGNTKWGVTGEIYIDEIITDYIIK